MIEGRRISLIRKEPALKPVSWFSLILIPIFILAGCAPVSPTIQPIPAAQIPSPTKLPVTDTAAPTSTPTWAITDTPLPTATQTLLAALPPDRVKETMQPLLQDPMNCADLCFLGITPGKTTISQLKAFFGPLGLQHRKGTDSDAGSDFYSVGYESNIGRDSYVTFYLDTNFVEDSIIDNIVIQPDITHQTQGNSREWIAFSPETLIKRYGSPSRVEFYLAWPGMGGSEVVMNMYYDVPGLIVSYTGENMLPSGNHSPRLCPLTAPFDYVRLWMGPNPPYEPLAAVPLENATSLTMDQFTQLMLGDPQNACFQLNQDAFLDK